MIKLRRIAKPKILEQKSGQWTLKLLSATTKKEKDNAQKKYNHNQVKQALIDMFNGKCAYCESKITHIDYGHIEHFKPKHKFKDLCFEWSNLLLACGVCNGAEHKGEKFPDDQEGGPIINPCEDDPGEHFIFSYDFHARLATVVDKTVRGKVTKDLLGLNRNDLRDYRSRQVNRLLVLKKLAQTDPEAAALFHEAQLDSSEYSAFAKALAGQIPIQET